MVHAEMAAKRLKARLSSGNASCSICGKVFFVAMYSLCGKVFLLRQGIPFVARYHIPKVATHLATRLKTHLSFHPFKVQGSSA
jgi:hypothetical protein